MTRILLVEDDRNTGVLLEHVLHSAGYAVDFVSSAAAAERRLADTHYAMVVADWRLSDGDGIALADQAAARGIKTAILTGYAFQIPSEVLARHELWLKPMRPVELVSAIERCIGSAVKLNEVSRALEVAGEQAAGSAVDDAEFR